jgi:hypothetical protein
MGLKRTDDEAERTLFILNSHLTRTYLKENCPILPAGVLITLPDLFQKQSQKQAQEQTQTDSVVNLWD